MSLVFVEDFKSNALYWYVNILTKDSFNPNRLFLLHFIPRPTFYFHAWHTLHTEKSPSDSGRINLNPIVFTFFRVIWNRTGFRLFQIPSENVKYNLIWDKLSRSSFLCAYKSVGVLIKFWLHYWLGF